MVLPYIRIFYCCTMSLRSAVALVRVVMSCHCTPSRDSAGLVTLCIYLSYSLSCVSLILSSVCPFSRRSSNGSSCCCYGCPAVSYRVVFGYYCLPKACWRAPRLSSSLCSFFFIIYIYGARYRWSKVKVVS